MTVTTRRHVVVTGQLLDDATGKPLAGGFVEVWREVRDDAETAGPRRARRLRAAPDGRFRLALRPRIAEGVGFDELVVGAAGHERVRLRPHTRWRGGAAHVTLRLRVGRTLAGRVHVDVPDACRRGAVVAVLAGYESHRHEHPAETAAATWCGAGDAPEGALPPLVRLLGSWTAPLRPDGRFALDGVTAATDLRCGVVFAGCVLADGIAGVPASAAQPLVLAVRPYAPMRVRVLDEGGAPVRGARAEELPGADGRCSAGAARAGADGVAVVPCRTGGRVRVGAPGHLPREFLARPASDARTHDVTLERGRALAGCVTDVVGAPVAGATVVVRPPAPARGGAASGVSGGDGTYAVPAAPSVDAVVRVSAPGFSPAAFARWDVDPFVTRTPDRTRALRRFLRPDSERGEVRLLPWAALQIALRCPDGVRPPRRVTLRLPTTACAAGRRATACGPVTATVERSGVARVARLVALPWRALLWAPGFVETHVTLDPRPGRVCGAVVHLEPCARDDATGRPAWTLSAAPLRGTR
mgnify:CR=1 FL=1